METVRSATGRMKTRYFRKHKQAAALSFVFFRCLLGPLCIQIRDTINTPRGLAGIAHDQSEHITILAILVQNGLERRRITRLVIFGIEFASFLLVFGYYSRLVGLYVSFCFFVRFICSFGISKSVFVLLRHRILEHSGKSIVLTTSFQRGILS
jgi:hypothetical protein